MHDLKLTVSMLLTTTFAKYDLPQIYYILFIQESFVGFEQLPSFDIVNSTLVFMYLLEYLCLFLLGCESDFDGQVGRLKGQEASYAVTFE